VVLDCVGSHSNRWCRGLRKRDASGQVQGETAEASPAPVVSTTGTCTRYEITGRLVVRRVLDANAQDPLSRVWRHHPFFAVVNNTVPATEADITHRRHAICDGFGGGNWIGTPFLVPPSDVRDPLVSLA
jgi:hypothetical protein